jgi:hypothetical protein
MPDKRAHRGPHPEDRRLFGPDILSALSAAYSDYCMLLDRGYPPTATLALVGDRYALQARQRIAVARCACTITAALHRQSRQAPMASLRGKTVWLDGFNVLVTVEAALAGGVVIVGRDGAYRDLASIHGTYRKVAETPSACELVGQALAELDVSLCRWRLDKPVSNSGRLKMLLLETASRFGWNWEVELAGDVDALLAMVGEPVATADSRVLDQCGPWVNLTRHVIDRSAPSAWIVDFKSNADNGPLATDN